MHAQARIMSLRWATTCSSFSNTSSQTSFFLRSLADSACCQTLRFLVLGVVRDLPALLIDICVGDMLPIHLPLNSCAQGTKGDVLDDELSSFVKQAKDAGRLACAQSDGPTLTLCSLCGVSLLLCTHFMLAVSEPRAVLSCTRISL